MIQKNIKNLVTLVLCVLLFTGTLSFPISCGETNIGASETNTSDSLPCVTYKYSFEQPEITQRTIGDRCYSRVALSGTSPYGQTGEPVLPVKEARILLPYQTTVDSIEIIPGTTTEIRLPFKIEPTGVPVPLSQSQYAHEPLPDQKIYSSSSSFPSQRFIDAGIQHFRGFSIINIVLYPVQYIPADDIITCVSDITVIVHLKEITTEPVLYRGFSIDFNDVSTFIDNSEILRTYPLRNLSSGSLTQYDLLIITTNYLKNGFLPLARFHALQGIKTRIVSLNQIPHSPQYSMRVTPEEIRDFIRDEYLNYGIRYVLLGGDDNVVPVQQLYFGEVEIWGMPIPVSGPSDFFYACLDGTYNYNGNDRWGEPHDGENGTDVDLISDIYVGRACVGTLNEVKNFTEKTLKYNQISINDDYFANTVMAGEYLWGPPEYPEEIYGDEYMEELIGGSSNNNYVTVGFPNDEYSLFNITRLYDRYHPWSAYQLKILINQGLNIINHLGHGNEEQALKMMKQEAYDLSNEKPCFIYSQACLAGAFDSEWSYDDCFTEYFHIKTNHGAFALIMNTRYGLGDGYGTDGPSQRFHRWFWDGVFDKEITEISAANHYSKTVNVPLIHTDQYLRFCCYEITYFGDPTVAFKFPKPDHDVDLVQTDLRPQVKSEDHIQVNVTLRNNGLYEEHNITLELLVDGHVSSQLFIPVLQKEQQKNVILDWVTPVAGEYTVMINVTVPEIVEHDYRNNRITQIVQVGVLNRDTQELFNCIQAAIDDDGTMAGHWILIPRGVYYENVVINKDILLKGEQKECTILEPLHSSDTVITFTQCQSASITGCTIQQGSVGVLVASSVNTLIRDCIVKNNQDIGIAIEASSASWINSNLILQNVLGICINTSSTTSHICRNTIQNTQNAFDSGSQNQWNSTNPGVGNWWSDYENNPGYPTGVYQIPGGFSIDYYPLSAPYTPEVQKSVINFHTGERFSTINTAILDSETQNGHLLFVGEGIYNETFTIGKSIALFGAGKDTTTIRYNTQQQVVLVTAPNVILNGFTIRNTEPGVPGRFPRCLTLRSNFNHIESNAFEGVSSDFQRGLQIDTSSTQNVIIKNTFLNVRMWLYISSRDNRIYHNNFIGSIVGVNIDGQHPNTWNDTYPTGGNYWSIWSCTGNPSNGTQPFIIDSNNIDYYPFQDPDGWE